MPESRGSPDADANGDASWPHREPIKVRYQEVDAQRVVFNAHYLGWCDVACAAWMEQALGWTGADDDVDWMLVKAVIEWQGSSTFGDTVDIDCGISRWGNRSFDIFYRGTVQGGAVFAATITYVTIEPGTKQSIVVPPYVREALAPVPGR